jgi:hypothetical protein
MAAGHVFIAGIVALLVGALLNAPGLRKTALNQPVGWRRDLARFVAEPLYDLSHALYFDRLRIGIQDIAGREGSDDVDLTLPSPTTTTPATPTTTAAPRERFSPSKRLKLWIGGDSLSVTPGESFINFAGLIGIIDVVGHAVDGHVATGLARPEQLNWPAFLLDVKKRDNPDVFVLTIGPNDDQTLTGEGGTGPFATDAWDVEYRRRVGGLMDELTGDGKHKLFLIGAPIIRDTNRSETRYKIINRIYRTEAAKRPGLVYYVDIYDMFRGPDGGYADYLTSRDGSVVQVRLGDGIHFTREGGNRIAQKILDRLLRVYDLTSWQKNVPTSTTTKPAATRPTSSTKPG